MHVAADAVGAGWLGENRAAMAGFLVGLLATFLFVRVNTRLIRAKVSWWFHDIESEGGTHVHHMVIGVVLMATVGILMIATAPAALLAQALALLFGVGVALTLDEFALILHLQDVYWRDEGRLSVDAVVIVVCAASLIVLGLDPLSGIEDSDASAGVVRAAVAIFILVDIVPVVLCLLKGKIWTGVIGLFVPTLAVIGAIRLARPNSPWARRRYRERPAQARQGAAPRGTAERAHHRLARRLLRPDRRQAAPALAAGRRRCAGGGGGPAGGRGGQRRGGRPGARREVAAAQAPAAATTARSSRNRRCAGTMASRAAARSNQAARSTSGNSAVLPDRGGHSMVKVLLVMAVASQSCSTAQAKISLWRCALTPPSGRKGPSGSSPVSSRTSRSATARRSAAAARLRALAAVAVAGSGPSSCGSASPLGMLHAPASLPAQYGPPGCTSSTSTRRPPAPGPAARR